MICGICETQITEDADPYRHWSEPDEAPVCETCVELAVEFYGNTN